MNPLDNISNYIDFIENELFITWRLTHDESLEKYWNEYLEKYPELLPHFEKAVEWFNNQHIKLDIPLLPKTDKLLLLNRIKEHANIKKKPNRILYLMRYAVAACLIGVLGLSLYYHLNKESTDIDNDLIIGKSLEEEMISFTSSSVKKSFQKDIKIEINKKGEVVVLSEKEDEVTIIEIDKKALNELKVPNGKRSNIILADGTKIWINSGSTLHFPSQFSPNTRDIYLTGEAYLEVSENKEKPFIIHTSDMDIKVYGTSFNISAYNDEPVKSVVLVEGSVGIKPKDQSEELLVPNDRLAYVDEKWVKEKVDVSKYISWKNGYLIFDDTPMAEVLKQVARYYNLSFEFGKNNKISERTCTGKLYLSDNMDNVMTAISILSSSDFSRENQHFYIK